MIEGIVWISLLAVILYSFWIKGWSKVWDERVVSFFIDIDKKDLPAVTMIIPFRNEELNLPNLLGAINCFDYPVDLLELIFVNDHSEDASVSLVQNCKLKYPYKLIHSDEEGKKSAISKGVVLAKNTWIVTTDVDTVWGEQSLRHLMSHPKLHEVEMICGVVEMIPQNGALLHQLQSLEYSILQAAGISSLFRFEPLLNSGANLEIGRAHV